MKKNHYPSSPKNFGFYEILDVNGRKLPIITVGGTFYDMGRWIARLSFEIYSEGMEEPSQKQKSPFDNYIQLGVRQGIDPEMIEKVVYLTGKGIKPYITREWWEQVVGGHDELRELGQPVNPDLEFTWLAISDLGERRCCMLGAQPPATTGDTYLLRQIDQAYRLEYHLNPRIIVRHPQNSDGEPAGIPYADVGYHGNPGTHTGMNAHGVCLGQVSSDFADPPTVKGRPMLLIIEEILRKCRNTEEAAKLLFWSSRSSSETYITVDTEQRSNSLQIHQASAAKMFTSNQGEKINTDYITIDDFKFYEPIDGIVYWAGIYELLNQGLKHVSSKHLHKVLQPLHGQIDHRKLIDVSKTFGHRQTILSCIFNASTQEIWVAFARGSNPSHEQEYTHINLRQFLTIN